MTSEMMPCHECNGTGLIGMKVGARHQCNLCEGEGKFADRRATRPAPAGDLAALLQLHKDAVNACVSWKLGEITQDDAAKAEATFRIALSALQAEVREVTGPIETAWLVEAKSSVFRAPHYFQLEYDNDWTPDANKALRFSRRQDAETMIEHHGWTDAFASEHIWDDGRAAALHEKMEG